MAAKKKEPAVEAELKAVFDNYEVVEMDRTDIQGAPYNPRVISDGARAKLRAGLKKHGLLAPPVWNKRTGNLVSGHQRLSQLDTLNGSPKYRLKIAVVDMDLAAEKEANLLFNNVSAMGDWDLEKLEEILRDETVALEGTGFDMADVYRLLGDMPGGSQQNVDDLAQRLRGFQEAYANVSDNTGRDDFYMVVVFRDYASRTDFLQKLGLEDNRYQDGKTIAALIVESKQKAEVVAAPEGEK